MTQRFKPSYATVTANFRSGTSQSVWAAAARPPRRGSNALSLLTRPSWRGMTATWANGLPPFAFSSNSSLSLSSITLSRSSSADGPQWRERGTCISVRSQSLNLYLYPCELLPWKLHVGSGQPCTCQRDECLIRHRGFCRRFTAWTALATLKTSRYTQVCPRMMLPVPSRAIYPVSEIARRIVKSVRHELRRGSCGAGRFRSGCACTSLARTPSRPRDEWQVPRLRRPVLPASEKMCCVRSESQGGFHASVTRTAQGRTACVSG